MHWSWLPEYDSIPQEWRVCRLGTVIEIVSGQSPDGSTISTERVGEPFLQGNAEFGAHHPVAAFHCTAAKKRSQAGDTLISVRAPVGEVNYSDQSYGLGRGLAALRAKDIDGAFLFYGMQHWRRSLLRVSQGTTFDAIGEGNLRSMWVCLPNSLAEQSAVGNAFALIESNIAATQAAIAAAERLQRGLMRELLAGRIRPDGSARTAADFWSDERLGHVPHRWEVRRLRELIRLKNGKSNVTSNLRSNREGDYQFPVFGGNGMTGWSDRFFLPEPTVVVGRVGEYCGAIHATPPNSWVTDNALYVEERLAPLDVRFLFHLLTSLRLNRWKATTGQPKITQSEILNIRVAFPEDEDEQRAIADRLAAFHELIRAKEAKIATLQRLKKSLMQNLLTGRVRLSAETIAALNAPAILPAAP